MDVDEFDFVVEDMIGVTVGLVVGGCVSGC